jgi:hypothetical protein
MSTKEKSILLTLGGLITTLVLYLTVRLGTSDTAFSIIPGWHTTIYPPDITWTILTIIILVTSLLVYLIFRVTVKLDFIEDKDEIVRIDIDRR